MTKLEKKKLHGILTTISKRLDKIDAKLDTLSAVEKLVYKRITELEKSVANLYLVAEETQRQQRETTPELKIISNKNGGTGRQKPTKSDR